MNTSKRFTAISVVVLLAILSVNPVEAEIAQITFEGVKLNQAFNKDVFTYTVKVPSATQSVRITTTLSPVQVTANAVPANATPAPIVSTVALNYGPNAVSVLDSGKVYNFTVNRANPGALRLSALDVRPYPAGGALQPAFSPEVFAYSMALPYNKLGTSVGVGATAQDPTNRAMLNGPVTGPLSPPPALTSVPVRGPTAVVVRVTSADGSVWQYYVVNVTLQ